MGRQIANTKLSIFEDEKVVEVNMIEVGCRFIFQLVKKGSILHDDKRIFH